MSQFTAIIFALSLLACGREEAISEHNSTLDQEETKEREEKGNPETPGNDNETIKNEELPSRDELNDESALPPMATTGAFFTSCYLHKQKILCSLEDEGVIIEDDAEVSYRLEIKLFAGEQYIDASHYDVKVLTHDEWLFKIELDDSLAEYSGSLLVDMKLIEVYPDGNESVIADLRVKQQA